MYNYSKLSYQLKREIKTLSSKISKGLSRPKFKFVFEMLYGLLESQSSHLSDIARALKEKTSIRALNTILSLLIGLLGTFAEKHNDSILVFHIIECSKRIFDRPKFIFYALGDGIFNILKKTKEGVRLFLEKTPPSQQLNIFKAFKLKDPSAFWF
jgi:hypothetical protein